MVSTFWNILGSILLYNRKCQEGNALGFHEQRADNWVSSYEYS